MWRTLSTSPGGRFVVPDGGVAVSAESAPARTEMPSSPGQAFGPIQVPDLLGMNSQDARRSARLAELHLVLEDHPTAAGLRGRVFRQEPEPGTLMRSGGLVTAYIGARPAIPVPDVRGADEETSLEVLRSAGLHPHRRVVRRSNTVPQGQIIRTRPRAGAEVPVGSRITYIVAAAPRPRQHSDRPGPKWSRARRAPDGAFLSMPDHDRM